MAGIKGKSGRKKGYKHSEETIIKISLATKGLKKDDSWKFGRKLSEEHKKNIGKSNMGHKVRDGTKMKLRESCKNCSVVHHINRNNFDDRPENRILLNPREHAQIHIIQGDIKPYGNKNINFKELKMREVII